MPSTGAVTAGGRENKEFPLIKQNHPQLPKIVTRNSVSESRRMSLLFQLPTLRQCSLLPRQPRKIAGLSSFWPSSLPVPLFIRRQMLILTDVPYFVPDRQRNDSMVWSSSAFQSLTLAGKVTTNQPVLFATPVGRAMLILYLPKLIGAKRELREPLPG